MPNSRLPLFAATILIAASCNRADSADDRASSESSSAPASPSADSSRAEVMGITTTDGSVRLSLLRDRVSMGLSDSVLAKVRKDLDSSASKRPATGIAGSFAHMVTSTVSNAIGRRVERPLSEIDDVRYENGAIVFTFRGGKPFIGFDNVKSGSTGDSKPVLQQFAPADAERFVAATRTALGKK